jgi:fructose-specific phosphotransferase system IIA component
MDLEGLLQEDQVIHSLKSHTKNAVINELIQVLAKKGKVTDKHKAYKNIMERENLLSTGMEKGLAVPHAKTDAVDELVIAFGLQREGVDFQSLDGQPAHFIFLVLSPLDTSGPHIKALAQISRSIKSDQTREKLLQAASAGEIINLLT